MNNFQLKIIALVTMAVDHVGYFLLDTSTPEYLLFRIIGRLSFVLFAFLITEGMTHTKNQNRYIINLLIFACVIDLVPRFILPLFGTSASQVIGFTNVFFTLGLGALGIYIYQSNYNLYVKIVSILLLGLSADFIGSDYGSYGVFLIVLIYVVKSMLPQHKLAATFVLSGFYMVLTFAYQMAEIQLFGVAAFILICFYNGERGWYHPQLKYLIYVFYPAHILVLATISIFIGG